MLFSSVSEPGRSRTDSCSLSYYSCFLSFCFFFFFFLSQSLFLSLCFSLASLFLFAQLFLFFSVSFSVSLSATGLGCADARPVRVSELSWVGEAAVRHRVDVCLGVIEHNEDDQQHQSNNIQHDVQGDNNNNTGMQGNNVQGNNNSDEKKDSRAFNSVLWFSGSSGLLCARYRKMHLFDYGSLCESSRIAPGSAPSPLVSLCGHSVGLSVCYDLRFPALFTRLARMGATIIVAPSAFTVATGAAHWRALLVARALDAQCFVAAAAQSGQHSESRRSWGESMLVDPWGRVVAKAPSEQEGEHLLVHDCDLNLVTETRNKMPLQQHAIKGLDYF